MGLLDKLIAAAATAAGPLCCPQCGRKAGRVAEGAVAVCGHCGWRGSLLEWAPRGDQAAAFRAVDPDRPPPGTKVVRRDLGGGAVAWEVPPSGRSGGLMFFAVIWNGFILLFTAVFGGAMLGGKLEGDAPGWLAILFLIPFWAVGIGLAYAVVRMKFARHLVVVDSREAVLVRSMFGRTKRRALAREGLEAVEKSAFYQQNDRPVHGVELRGRGGRLRFGSALTEEEKNWLVADIRRTVWPQGAPAAAPSPAVATAPAPLAEAQPGAPFTVDLPPGRGAGRWVGLALGMLVAGGFLTIGVVAMRDAGFFRHLWLASNSLFLLALCAAAVGALRNAGVTIRVTADRGEIRVQRMKGPRVIGERRLPRAGVEVRAFESGRANGTRMMRVELVGPHGALPVARWRPDHEVDALVQQLRRHLPGGARPFTSP